MGWTVQFMKSIKKKAHFARQILGFTGRHVGVIRTADFLAIRLKIDRFHLIQFARGLSLVVTEILALSRVDLRAHFLAILQSQTSDRLQQVVLFVFAQLTRELSTKLYKNRFQKEKVLSFDRFFFHTINTLSENRR